MTALRRHRGRHRGLRVCANPSHPPKGRPMNAKVYLSLLSFFFFRASQLARARRRRRLGTKRTGQNHRRNHRHGRKSGEESLLDVPLTMSAFNEQMIEELGMTSRTTLNSLFRVCSSATTASRSARERSSAASAPDSRGRPTRTWRWRLTWTASTPSAPTGSRPTSSMSNGSRWRAGPPRHAERAKLDRRIDQLLHQATYRRVGLAVSGEFTDQTTQRYNGAFGGPLGGNLSFRLTGGSYTGDGAQENLGPGGDYAAPDQTSLAPQLRYKTDRLDVNIRIALVNDDGSPRMQVPLSDRDRTSECFENPLALAGGSDDEEDEDEEEEEEEEFEEEEDEERRGGGVRMRKQPLVSLQGTSTFHIG